MVCFCQAQDISGIFNDRMLDTTTCSQKGNSMLSCKANSTKRSFHALVRASWHTPECIISGQQLLSIVFQVRCGKPECFSLASKGIRGQFYRPRNCNMCLDLGVEVTDKSDTDCTCHSSLFIILHVFSYRREPTT